MSERPVIEMKPSFPEWEKVSPKRVMAEDTMRQGILFTASQCKPLGATLDHLAERAGNVNFSMLLPILEAVERAYVLSAELLLENE